MKKSVIYILLVVAIVIAAIFIYKNIQSPSDNVIRVGYKLNSGYQIYFVAKDKGFFEKYGINVQGISFTSTNQMMQAIMLGQIDATAAGSIEVIAATNIESPDNIKIYNTLIFNEDNSFYSIIIPENSDINSITDLKGKKIGVLPGSTTMSFLKAICDKFFDSDSIEIVQLELRVQLQALSLKQVDALYTVDPIVTLSQTKKLGKVLIKGPENKFLLNPMATGAGVLSSSFYKDNPNITNRFINALDETIDYMRENEEQTREIVAKNTNLEKDVADNINLINYWKLNETNFFDVQKYLDFLYSENIISKKIKAEDLYIKK